MFAINDVNTTYMIFLIFLIRKPSIFLNSSYANNGRNRLVIYILTLLFHTKQDLLKIKKVL